MSFHSEHILKGKVSNAEQAPGRPRSLFDQLRTIMSLRRVSLHVLDDLAKSPAGTDTKLADYGTSPRNGSESDLSLDEGKSKNPFADAKVAEHYRQVYDNAQYECRHVYNPDLEWTQVEEKKLLRKLDRHVALLACFMFFALNLDRGMLRDQKRSQPSDVSGS